MAALADQTSKQHTPAASVADELLNLLLDRQDGGDAKLDLTPSELIDLAYQRARA